jgi:hypothetical protein
MIMSPHTFPWLEDVEVSIEIECDTVSLHIEEEDKEMFTLDSNRPSFNKMNICQQNQLSSLTEAILMKCAAKVRCHG